MVLDTLVHSTWGQGIRIMCGLDAMAAPAGRIDVGISANLLRDIEVPGSVPN